MEEPLLFEQDADGRTGVDLPEAEGRAPQLGGLERKGRVGLPGLSEPQIVRHFTRLSQKNYAIDSGFYPLGSCTMKHNPRLNEKMVRLPGFAMAHPLQPQQTVQGCLELISTLAHWITTLTGMPGVAMSPAAGAHGELAGLMTIRAALTARGDARKTVLVPESAHGTNPATAALCDYKVESIPANARGRIDLDALKAAMSEDVAALMLTNPNTCGLFENEILEVADVLHDAGAFFYGDGANFNAIVGRVRPGDLGIDAMHLNLHKTFSTPHGGGGPGSGPVVLSEPLIPYAPIPYVVADGDGFRMVEHDDSGDSFGRLRSFHGQMGMFVRALAYMMSHGADGLRHVAEDAVLNANYVMARLKDTYNVPFPGPCMHECLFDDHSLKNTGVTTLDIAKGMIDEGFHPMTMYFPLVVHGAMLIEPTETESKASVDQFCDTMLHLMERAQSGDADWFHEAPHLAPWRRLDETAAARRPVLTWKPEEEKGEAA
jgi:glycine dehydrogenase subunit 2